MGGIFLASLTDPTLTATTAARDAFAFALAPNPAHALASVQLPPVSGATTATLTLLDALGRTVHTRPATPGTRTDFDLSGLAPGLYALRATAGAATATQRLVVE
ncbi:MAG: T9SS type A sorting domain-containing protein [Bacteroidota bacterium]|nr:T9SS type A sorting domain-containing protein [Bacteroidota bacterium]